MKKKTIFVVSLILFTIVVAGCTGDFLGDEVDTDQETGQLALFIADNAVNDLDHVYVYIDEVNVNHVDGGWETINNFEDEEDEMLKVDLLQLRFTEEKLGEEILDAGNYDKIRLKLADEDGQEYLSRLVFKNGDEMPLKVPAGSEKGFQIDYDFEIEGDTITQIVLDVDLTKLVFAGQSGKVLLNTESINIIDKIYAGNILGEVLGETEDGENGEISAEPIQDLEGEDGSSRDVYVEAYNSEVYDEETGEFNEEPIARAVALNEELEDTETIRNPGEFMLRGLPDGEYKLRAFVGYRDDDDEVQIDDDKFKITIYEELVSVSAGENTDLDDPIILSAVDLEETEEDTNGDDSGEDEDGDNSEEETD